MVGKCPQREEAVDLVAGCQRVSTPYSHLMDVPVLSLATNRTYVNIFCARCHSDVGNLKEWTTRVHCDVREVKMLHQ